MKLRHTLLFTILASLTTTGLASDFGSQAEARLRQTYDRHGGVQQAREQLHPLAEKKLGTCRLCHGPNGNSSRDVMPSLAGERAAYLLQRWYELIDGHGESGTASRIARRINEQQMIALALYFSEQKRTAVDFDADLAESGKPLFDRKCSKCHLEDGHGKDGMPVIAGQQPEYMARTMLQFRENTGWRHQSNMRKPATPLSPIQVKAVANYAASLGQ